MSGRLIGERVMIAVGAFERDRWLYLLVSNTSKVVLYPQFLSFMAVVDESCLPGETM
jgi:hypothetical protein